MYILLGIKKYFYLAIGLATTLFLGWVYWLKKDNEAKEEEIEDLEYEAVVAEAVHEEEKKVAEFAGVVKSEKDELAVKVEEAQKEYDDAWKESDEATSVDDGYTFT